MKLPILNSWLSQVKKMTISTICIYKIHIDPEIQYHSYTNTSTLSIQINLHNLFINPVLLCFKIFCIHKCLIFHLTVQTIFEVYMGSGPPRWNGGKDSACQYKRCGFSPWERFPWRNVNPLQYSCLKNFHGQRSLAGYNPCGCRELDRTEETACTHTCNRTIKKCYELKFYSFGFGYARSWLLGGLFSSCVEWGSGL